MFTSSNTLLLEFLFHHQNIPIMMLEEDVKKDLENLVKKRDLEVKAEETMINSEVERKAKRNQSYSNTMFTELKKQNIDIDAIISIEKSRVQGSKNEREKIRSQLINSTLDEAFITPPFPFEEAHSAWYEDVFLKPVYTKVYRGSKTITEGYGIGDVRAGLLMEGEGIGWPFAAASVGPLKIDRYFTFIPPKTGFYSLQIFQPYNGFYRAYADDGFLTSNHTEVRIESIFKAKQYYWHPETRVKIKSVKGYHVDAVGRIDNVFQSYYQDTFSGGDVVELLVTQELDCWANGDGSVAEINFKDGISNVLHAPFLNVIPPT